MKLSIIIPCYNEENTISLIIDKVIEATNHFDKEIIVMDEATSSLDEKTENFILEQIKELKRKKTIIIITHNKNTLKYCDKVYEIINEKIRKK